jgi:GT2 family glycosyltransferase
MKCSVVILNWNGEHMLRTFLPLVLLHTQLDDVEIVVADNGSTDGSLSFLQTQAVRIISLERNYGFAEGYNRAIAQIDSEYVVLLNSDVEVTPNWLETMLGYMDKHPETMAIQP